MIIKSNDQRQVRVFDLMNIQLPKRNRPKAVALKAELTESHAALNKVKLEHDANLPLPPGTLENTKRKSTQVLHNQNFIMWEF